jgi:hypothetical protein
MSEETKTPPEDPRQPPEPEPAQTDQPKPAGAITRVKAEVIPIEKGRGVSLRSFEDLQRWSLMVTKSGMAPKNMTMEQVAVATQTGMEVGLTPMSALRAIYVINGLPAFKGAAALGLLQSRPDLCVEIDVGCVWDEQGPAFGFCRTRRRNQPMKEDRYTRAQAQAAGRWNKTTRAGEATPWMTDPDQMLLWRAVGRHCGKWWADLLYGFPIVEAMDEFQGYTGPDAPPPPPSGPAGPVDRPAKDPILELLEEDAPEGGTLPEPEAGPQMETLEDQLNESLRGVAAMRKAGAEAGVLPPLPTVQEPRSESGTLFPEAPAPPPSPRRSGRFLRGKRRR